jgi:uncharacterized protein
MEELVPMDLVDVRVDQATNNPVVILRAQSADPDSSESPPHGPPGPTVLPIFIGNIEAQAIRIGMEGRPTPRPMTHDLLAAVISAMNATVSSVVITETRENIFYAEIRIKMAGTDELKVVSARPSDAIALCARIKAPLYVNAVLLAEQGLVETSREPGDPDEIVEEFRQFLDDINPDDFNS